MSARLLEGPVRTGFVVGLLPRWPTTGSIALQLLKVYPAARLDIRVEEDPVGFARHDVDLGLLRPAPLSTW